MQAIPYLFFSGRCAEAMRFYAATFGCPEPQILGADDMPEAVRAGMEPLPEGAVMHAALDLGQGWLFASDDPAGAAAMAGARIHLAFPTPARAGEVFAALAEGGRIDMPLAPTFWAPAFGTLTDRFGIRWMIAAEAA